MKKFYYYYWFAYPCLSEPVIEQVGNHRGIIEEFNEQQFNDFNQTYFQEKNSSERSFFILQKENNGQLKILRLAEKINAIQKDDNFAIDDLANIYFCFSDPCATPDIAGWTARLYFTMLIHLWLVLKLT